MGVAIQEAPFEGCASNPAIVAHGNASPIVEVPFHSLDETAPFYASMHELGHHATWKEHPLQDASLFNAHMLGVPDRAILDNEAAATQWAFDNAGETITADAYWFTHSALLTYLNAYRDGSSAPRALFREIFNRTCDGMRGSTLTMLALHKLYPHIDVASFLHTFEGAEDSTPI